MRVRLVDAYTVPNAPDVLYDLLKERPSHANISHKQMPGIRQHLAFFDSHPYLAWYLVMVGDEVVGATYLTKHQEIGIFIFQVHAGHKYGETAIQLLMQLHPGPCLANVAPENHGSTLLFEKLGGKRIQVTYALS